MSDKTLEAPLIALLLASLLLTPPPTDTPQEEGKLSPSLTLSTALSMAETRLESFELAEAQVERAALLRRQALASMLPQVSLQGLLTHNSYEIVNSSGITLIPDDNVTGTGALSVSLFNATALPAWRTAARNEATAEATMEAQKTSLRYAVAQAYYLVLSSDEQLLIRQSALEAAQESLRVARQRQSAGVALPTVLSRAELEEANALANLQDARVARLKARTALEWLIDGTLPGTLIRPSEPELPNDCPEELLRLAFITRPDLKAATRKLEAASVGAESAWMTFLPSLALTGSFKATPYPGYVAGGFPLDPVTWQLGLKLDIPVYDGGARTADLSLKALSQREAALELERAQRQVRKEVADALEALTSLEARRLATEKAKAAAELNATLVAAMYEAGRASPVEMADAQAALTSARVSEVLTGLQIDLARLELRRALGLEPLNVNAERAPVRGKEEE